MTIEFREHYWFRGIWTSPLTKLERMGDVMAAIYYDEKTEEIHIKGRTRFYNDAVAFQSSDDKNWFNLVLTKADREKKMQTWREAIEEAKEKMDETIEGSANNFGNGTWEFIDLQSSDPEGIAEKLKSLSCLHMKEGEDAKDYMMRMKGANFEGN